MGGNILEMFISKADVSPETRRSGTAVPVMHCGMGKTNAKSIEAGHKNEYTEFRTALRKVRFSPHI